MTGVAGGAQTVAEAVLAWLAVFAALVAVQLMVTVPALPAVNSTWATEAKTPLPVLPVMVPLVAVHRNELPVLPTTSALEGPPAVRFVAWSVTCGVLGGATTARLVLPWMEAAPAAFVSVHPSVSGPVDAATNVLEVL